MDGRAHDRRSDIGTNSGDPKAVVDFLRRPDFFRRLRQGSRLTLRDWNQQLSPTILLVDGRMVVSVSPQRVFCIRFRTRYTRRRSAPKPDAGSLMQAALKKVRIAHVRRCMLSGMAAWLATAAPFAAFVAMCRNEKAIPYP